MGKEVILNLDGTLDTYDEDACKILHYCGDWSLLHRIFEAHIHPRPSELEPQNRITAATFIILNNKTKEKLELSKYQVERFLEYIIQPQKPIAINVLTDSEKQIVDKYIKVNESED